MIRELDIELLHSITIPENVDTGVLYAVLCNVVRDVSSTSRFRLIISRNRLQIIWQDLNLNQARRSF